MNGPRHTNGGAAEAYPLCAGRNAIGAALSSAPVRRLGLDEADQQVVRRKPGRLRAVRDPPEQRVFLLRRPWPDQGDFDHGGVCGPPQIGESRIEDHRVARQAMDYLKAVAGRDRAGFHQPVMDGFGQSEAFWGV